MDGAQRIRGCLLGGAVGDAMGAVVEFLSWGEIRSRFGDKGLAGYSGSDPAAGRFTDDTQMTLFTLEGLIRASVRSRGKGICHVPSVVHHAYLRWLHTQGTSWKQAAGPFAEHADHPDGWLVQESLLHRREAPGRTCLSALASGRAGSVDEPINNSKGCGGVMRIAPVGLVSRDPAEAFRLGCEIAALTHGHPSGWLPAGVLAATVAGLFHDLALPVAFDDARRLLDDWDHPDETAAALDDATALAARGLPGPEDLERLGGGWVGEEALAIAVCCALAAPDLRSGVLAAVNHSGDSDSTGSIAGNLLGAALGPHAIPRPWLDQLGGRSIIETIAADAWTEFQDPPRGPPPTGMFAPDDTIPGSWWERYPGW